MAENKKISELPRATEVQGNELIPIVQNGANKAVEADIMTEGCIKTIRIYDGGSNKTVSPYRSILQVNVGSGLTWVPTGSADLGASIIDVNTNYVATKNELDVIETLAESVNQGLGETIQRVDALESGLQADKTNLANFKAHVEADFVKDADYNNDKGTIMGQIMNKADKSMFWTGTQAEYEAISHDAKTLYFIKEEAKATTLEILEALPTAEPTVDSEPDNTELL